jgi:multidrug efflux pump subunit AcrA (membrane-fusion protein)
MPDEFADIPDDFRGRTRARLEEIVIVGDRSHPSGVLANARAELVRRDHEFQREMSEAADNREINRQRFDEELAKRQMDHAAALAREQLDTAQSAARAARMAAWAAVAAALGAITQAVIAIVK